MDVRTMRRFIHIFGTVAFGSCVYYLFCLLILAANGLARTGFDEKGTVTNFEQAFPQRR